MIIIITIEEIVIAKNKHETKTLRIYSVLPKITKHAIDNAITAKAKKQHRKLAIIISLYPCDFPDGFNPEDYRIFQGEPQIILRDGDCLDPGGREIRVVHTPGHSPGHCCFYEPDRQYMYTGDLVYEGCLDAFYPTTDPILMYKSVKRISQYEVSRILPGHHRLDIPVSLVSRVEHGFTQIEQQGLLRQGNGLFEFDGFQIRI